MFIKINDDRISADHVISYEPRDVKHGQLIDMVTYVIAFEVAGEEFTRDLEFSTEAKRDEAINQLDNSVGLLTLVQV